jgi:pre-mRNA-processing factor 19
VTGEDLTEEELIEIKYNDMVRTRPPTVTSIPSLLSSLQTEWDAIALETFSLRQQLAETKRELSTALYQNDAAVRVVARLTKERDEAREALSKLTASLSTPTVESMEVDGHENGSGTAVPSGEVIQALGQHVVDRIVEKQQELQSGRRKRPISDDWATEDDIRSFSEKHKTKQLFTTVSCGAAYDNMLITGGGKGKVGVFHTETNNLDIFNVEGIVTSIGWSPDGTNIVIGTKTGSVDAVLLEGLKHLAVSADLHQAPVIFAGYLRDGSSSKLTVDKDGIYNISEVNVPEARVDLKHSISAAALHPDGTLAAFGTPSGRILFYEITTSQIAARAETGDSVHAIEFSENGYWMAVGVNSSVLLYDLRKAPGAESVFEPVASLPFETLNGPVSALAFDYASHYLIAGTPHGFEVISYDKSKKAWNANVFSSQTPAISVNWTSLAKSIAVVTPKGNIVIFG